MSTISMGNVEVFSAPDSGLVSFEVEGQGELWVSVEHFDGQFQVEIDEENTDLDVNIDDLDMAEITDEAVAAIAKKATQELSDPEALAIEPDEDAEWITGYWMEIDAAADHVDGGKMLVVLEKGSREVRYLLDEKKTKQVLEQWDQHLTRGGLNDDESKVTLLVRFLEEYRGATMPFGLGLKS